MANKVIYVRKIDEKVFEGAVKRAGADGIGAYLMRLARRDQLGLWQNRELSSEEKLAEAERLISEVRADMGARREMQKVES